MSYRLFRDEQIKSIKSSDTVKYTCESCGLYKSAYSPKMEPFGLYKLRIMNIGEAPGCVHGDTLIETAFRDKSIYPEGIPIRELVGQSGFYVYSYDFEKSDITLGKVTKVWKTGWKKTYRVTYEWFKSVSGGRKRYVNSIVVTKNHPFLLRKRLPGKDPFRGKEAKLFNGSMHRRYLSIESGLGVGYSLQPFLYSLYNNRRSIGTAGSRRRKEAILLTEFKIGRRILPNGQENCHHKDENTLNDTWDNLECLTTEEHRRHHSTISNASIVSQTQFCTWVSSATFDQTSSNFMLWATLRMLERKNWSQACKTASESNMNAYARFTVATDVQTILCPSACGFNPVVS